MASNYGAEEANLQEKTDQTKKVYFERKPREIDGMGDAFKNLEKELGRRKFKFPSPQKHNNSPEKQLHTTNKPRPRRPRSSRNPQISSITKEKVCSKLAEVLFDALQEERQEPDWNLTDQQETNDGDTDSPSSSSSEDVYSELSQLSTDRGLSQNLSQSGRLYKKSHDDYLKIGLFWDIENCPVPKGKSALHLVKKLRDTFCEDCTEEKFIVVCNAYNQSPTLAKDLTDVMVRIEHVSPGKNAADEILRRNIREFTENKLPETKVILITGDINFNSEIHEMRYKKHFKVVLIHNKQTSEALKICANQCISFEEFAADIPKRDVPVSQEPVGVSITNLPKNLDLGGVKRVLEPLVKTYSGKVSDILPASGEALAHFPNECLANRTVSALQNMLVAKSRIKLELTSGREEVENGDLIAFSGESSSSRSISPGSPDDPSRIAQVSREIRDPVCVSFHTEKKIAIVVLKQVLSVEIGSVDNLVFVSSKPNEHHYQFSSSNLEAARKVVDRLTSLKTPKLHNVRLIDGGEEVPRASGIKKIEERDVQSEDASEYNMEERKNKYLQIHEAKYETHKKKIDALMNQSCNSSITDEFKTLYIRIRLLERMKNEFLQKCDTIAAIRDKLEAEERLRAECKHLKYAFPVYAYRSAIIAAVSGYSVTIVAGNVASGKSTQIVQYLLMETVNSKIVYVQSNKALLAFVEEAVFKHQLKFPEGNEVNFDTDHCLLNECFRNKLMDGYTHVVIDQVQMRSPYTEVLLGYVKSVLEIRKNLKVVILCEKECVKVLCDYFKNGAVVEVDDWAHKPTVEEVTTTSSTCVRDCTNKAVEIVNSKKGFSKILLYLPNVSDINLSAELLRNELKNNPTVKICKLVPDLELNFREECRSLEKSTNSCIILTLKEVSDVVHIKNVKYIIDSGLTTIIYGGLFGSYVKTVESVICNPILNKDGLLYLYRSTDQASKNSENSRNREGKFLKVLSVFGLNQDIVSFKFLHPFGNVKSVINKLEKVKAIDKLTITKKGQLMLALPLDVHLANILVDGITDDIGFVALHFCAVALEVKHQSQYNDKGNLMAQLKKYFQPNSSNSALSKRIYEDLGTKLELAMAQCDMKYISARIPPDWELGLEKLLLKNWETNLCVLQPNGHYKQKSSDTVIKLSPDVQPRPQVFIFETICNLNAADCALTYIPINGLQDASESPLVTINPIGQHVMKSALIGSDGSLKVAWEKKLTKIAKSEVHLQPNVFAGEMKIYCSSESKDVILTELKKAVAEAQEKLSTQLWEYPICRETGVKMKWGKRAEGLKFFLPNQSLIVIVRGSSLSAVIKQFRKYGPIVHYSQKLLKKQRQAGVLVMYSNPTSAEHALTIKDKKFKVESKAVNKSIDRLPPFSILIVTWTRRLNIGMAIVNFDRSLSKHVVQSRIVNDRADTCYSGCDVVLELADKRILLHKLNPTVSKAELQRDLERKLDGLEVKLAIHVPQGKSFVSDDEATTVMHMRFRQLVTSVLGRNVDAFVVKPGDREELWTARVTVYDYLSPRVIGSLNQCRIDDCRLFVSETKPFFAFFTEKLFSPHEKAFKGEIQRKLCSKPGFLTATDTGGNGRTAVKCEGSVEHIVMAMQILSRKVNHTVIDLSKYDFPKEYSFGNLSEELEVISTERKAFIKYKKFAHQIVVSREAVKYVEKLLSEKLAKFLPKPILPYFCGEPNGLLCKLFEKYGPDLKALQKEVDAVHLKLDIKSKELSVWGGKEEEVKLKLDQFKSTNMEVLSKEKNTTVQCPICLGDPLQHEKHYKLEYCGHSYCPPCIGAVIAFCELPVSCFAEGCSSPVVYKDLKDFMKVFPDLLHNLASRAAMRYISGNKENLVFCPVSDCDAFFHRTKDIDQCFHCFNQLCVRCGVMYHYGQTCEEFQKTQETEPATPTSNTTFWNKAYEDEKKTGPNPFVKAEPAKIDIHSKAEQEKIDEFFFTEFVKLSLERNPFDFSANKPDVVKLTDPAAIKTQNLIASPVKKNETDHNSASAPITVPNTSRNSKLANSPFPEAKSVEKSPVDAIFASPITFSSSKYPVNIGSRSCSSVVFGEVGISSPKTEKPEPVKSNIAPRMYNPEQLRSVCPKTQTVEPKISFLIPTFDSVNPKIAPAIPTFESVKPKIAPAIPILEPAKPKITSSPTFESVKPKIVPPPPTFESVKPKIVPPIPTFESLNPKLAPAIPTFESVKPKIAPAIPIFEPAKPKITSSPTFESVKPKIVPPPLTFDSVKPKIATPPPTFESVKPKIPTPIPTFESLNPKLAPAIPTLDPPKPKITSSPSFESIKPKVTSSSPFLDSMKPKTSSSQSVTSNISPPVTSPPVTLRQPVTQTYYEPNFQPGYVYPRASNNTSTGSQFNRTYEMQNVRQTVNTQSQKTKSTQKKEDKDSCALM